MSAADPPTPVPPYLRPMQVPLGPGDERVGPSTEELRLIARLLDHEQLAGQTLVTMRSGSPWLELDVAVPVSAGRAVVDGQVDKLPRGGIYKYAIWRHTCKAYRLGRDGAVEDDPFL